MASNDPRSRLHARACVGHEGWSCEAGGSKLERWSRWLLRLSERLREITNELSTLELLWMEKQCYYCFTTFLSIYLFSKTVVYLSIIDLSSYFIIFYQILSMYWYNLYIFCILWFLIFVSEASRCHGGRHADAWWIFDALREFGSRPGSFSMRRNARYLGTSDITWDRSSRFWSWAELILIIGMLMVDWSDTTWLMIMGYKWLEFENLEVLAHWQTQQQRLEVLMFSWSLGHQTWLAVYQCTIL